MTIPYVKSIPLLLCVNIQTHKHYWTPDFLTMPASVCVSLFINKSELHQIQVGYKHNKSTQDLQLSTFSCNNIPLLIEKENGW